MSLLILRQYIQICSKPDSQAIEEFFAPREGLQIEENFARFVVPTALTELGLRPIKLTAFDLAEDASHSAVEQALQERCDSEYLFSECSVCWTLANAISRQEGGERGLLSNEDATLLYLPSQIVTVNWSVQKAAWVLDTEPRHLKTLTKNRRVVASQLVHSFL